MPLITTGVHSCQYLEKTKVDELVKIFVHRDFSSNEVKHLLKSNLKNYITYIIITLTCS